MTYLDHSREPLRPVVDTAEALQECLSALGGATGAVAFDTERAHGFRYSGRAYLIQLRRAGAGTVLLDPIPFTGRDRPADLSELADALADAEWVLHAATQATPTGVALTVANGARIEGALISEYPVTLSDVNSLIRANSRVQNAIRANPEFRRLFWARGSWDQE